MKIEWTLWDRPAPNMRHGQYMSDRTEVKEVIRLFWRMKAQQCLDKLKELGVEDINDIQPILNKVPIIRNGNYLEPQYNQQHLDMIDWEANYCIAKSYSEEKYL